VPGLAVPGGELLGLAGPLGDQTGEPAGTVSTGESIGVIPTAEPAGLVPAGNPGVGGTGMALSGGGPGGLASDGSVTPAG
jgi:hypothetical protein